jgi:hypothetical protein
MMAGEMPDLDTPHASILCSSIIRGRVLRGVRRFRGTLI